MAGNKRRCKAIGIDLGTTYSCVAIWHHGNVEIIANDQGNRTTPSSVAFTGTDRLVGDAAVNQCHSNPSNTIFGAKRLIGRKFNEAYVQNQIRSLPFKLEEGHENKPEIAVEYKGETKRFFPEVISSMILAYMKTTAETFVGDTVRDAVITVPAYFNDSQRRATKDAGHIAGLNVMRIINEPTAAAVAYGFDKGLAGGSKKNVLIFDFGGGTFDVSIVGVEGPVMEVKATGGDTYLGGEDLDELMLCHLVKEFQRKNGKDMSGNKKALRRLRTACEKAKRVLSTAADAVVDVDRLHEGVDFSHKFTRAKFEELGMELFNKCMAIVKQCLSDARMEKREIDDLVLVGGSTRIPKVQQMLSDLFDGKELCRSINPDEAVAYGAAVQAAKLTGEDEGDLHGLVLLDVTPLSLGTEILGGLMSTIIPRNTPIPVKMEETYVTVRDGQTAVDLPVYEGERSIVTDNNLLGKFEFGGLRAAPAGEVKVVVSFAIDADGILNVVALNKETGASKGVTISNEKGRMSEAEIERKVEEAKRFKAEDERRKEKAAARSGLETFVVNARFRVRGDRTGTVLSAATKRVLEDKLDTASKWVEANPDAGAREYKERTRKLEELFEDLPRLERTMALLNMH